MCQSHTKVNTDTSFTTCLIMMNFHYNQENKMILENSFLEVKQQHFTENNKNNLIRYFVQSGFYFASLGEYKLVLFLL